MHDNFRPSEVHPAASTPAPFSTGVAMTPRGEWVTTVDLGNGVSIIRLFDDEDEAWRYADDVTAWLRAGRCDQMRPILPPSFPSTH